MNKGICKFYGDLDKAVEAAQSAFMSSPEDDGRTSMLKIADHPMVTVMVRCKKFRREPAPPARQYW